MHQRTLYKQLSLHINYIRNNTPFYCAMTIYIQFILLISNSVWFEKKLWGIVRKKITVLRPKYTLMQHHLVFVNMKYFFVLHQLFFDDINTFLCNINTFLSKPNYFLCNVKLFILTQNYFSCNTKFLSCSSCIMLCHGDIFLLSHSNKNIITSQKINKLSFLCDTKKINFVFCASPFFYIQFLHYTLSACWSSS